MDQINLDLFGPFLVSRFWFLVVYLVKGLLFNEKPDTQMGMPI